MQSSRSRQTLRILAALVLTALAFAGCNSSSNQEEAKEETARPTIVFMTDFGTANDAVAICKGVMLSIAPDARIMDITHQVTTY